MEIQKPSLSALTIIVGLITAANGAKAISINNNTLSQAKHSLDTSRIAFLEGLLNKAVRGAVSGEAALKQTCGSNDQDVFDREQCKKAMKEVKMARSKYPIILGIIDQYQNTPNNLSSISNGKYQALTVLKKYCGNKIAERAAKTMRYWGTTEVGSYTLTSLNNMQAKRYKEVLNSCKKTSWVYSSIDKIEANASKNIAAIDALAATSDCNQSISSNRWNDKLLTEVKMKKERYSEARNISASLAGFENSANLKSNRVGVDKSKLQTNIISLDKSIKQCQFLAQQGESILVKRKRDEAAADRKRLADQQAANARAAEAAAAQRARNQKAAAAAAEKQRREKALQQNIEGVVLE